MSQSDFVSMFEIEVVGTEGSECVMCEIEGDNLYDDNEAELNVTYIEELDQLDVSDSLLQKKVEKRVNDQKTMIVQNLLSESQNHASVDKVS